MTVQILLEGRNPALTHRPPAIPEQLREEAFNIPCPRVGERLSRVPGVGVEPTRKVTLHRGQPTRSYPGSAPGSQRSRISAASESASDPSEGPDKGFLRDVFSGLGTLFPDPRSRKRCDSHALAPPTPTSRTSPGAGVLRPAGPPPASEPPSPLATPPPLQVPDLARAFPFPAALRRRPGTASSLLGRRAGILGSPLGHPAPDRSRRGPDSQAPDGHPQPPAPGILIPRRRRTAPKRARPLFSTSIRPSACCSRNSGTERHLPGRVHDRVERLLLASGVGCLHEPGDQVYYHLGDDRIVLPPPSRFAGAERYYQTLLHELGHGTGHPDRLNRPVLLAALRDGPDSPDQAREELRAEIGTLMTGVRIGLGHRPRHEGVLYRALDPTDRVRSPGVGSSRFRRLAHERGPARRSSQAQGADRRPVLGPAPLSGGAPEPAGPPDPRLPSAPRYWACLVRRRVPKPFSASAGAVPRPSGSPWSAATAAGSPAPSSAPIFAAGATGPCASSAASSVRRQGVEEALDGLPTTTRPLPHCRQGPVPRAGPGARPAPPGLRLGPAPPVALARLRPRAPPGRGGFPQSGRRSGRWRRWAFPGGCSLAVTTPATPRDTDDTSPTISPWPWSRQGRPSSTSIPAGTPTRSCSRGGRSTPRSGRRYALKNGRSTWSR